MEIKSIQEQEEEIIAEFALFDDWMDKYNFLIEMGREIPIIDPKYKIEQNLISGCQSRVWLHAKYTDRRLTFTADSDAVITKGIANLLIRVMNNQEAEAIINADFSFVNEIGLKEHLSPTRSNGLMSMIKQMKLYALAFKTKSNQS